jgi:hypothetical protein
MSYVSTRVESPEKISITLQATYTLEEWQIIAKALNKDVRCQDYPMNNFSDAIESCTVKAGQAFYPDNIDDD